MCIRDRGGSGRTLPFLILPQAEATGVRFDSTDTTRFNYTVTASRVDG